MLSDLSPLQRTLADLMSDLSEEGYCASWLIDLEYLLWESVLRLPHADARFLRDDADVARLCELSRACGGWIVYDDETRETWLPLDIWERRFSDRTLGRSLGRPKDGDHESGC